MHAVDDDSIEFVEDDCVALAAAPGAHWNVLIVDDDADVHRATEYALKDVEILGRNLRFLHAHTSDQALELLTAEPDVAVVLLDVVMESDDAGLKAVGQIRNELGLAHVRIILHTGQPGYAPELDAIRMYDINDYKTKSELTRNKLYTTVTAAIRSYDQIRRLDASRHGLELIIDGANRFIAEQGLHTFAAGVITQIAALLGVAPEGMMCACSAPGQRRCVILAAAGRYQGFINRDLVDLADTDASQMLVQCLTDRCNQLSEHGLALFFPGCLGRSFAAYVESTAAMREVDKHLLEVFCANIAICGDNVGLVERLRQTAYVDLLTELPNRTAQIETLDRRSSAPEQLAGMLALVDIDQFSETIDVLGFRFGDSLLQSIARRLRSALPADVYVARVGGDVFSVYGNEDVVNPAILREILFDPFSSEIGEQSVSFSLGLVRLDDTAVGGADLLRNAAIALKRAKVDGTGNDFYYTAAVAVQTRERVQLLQDLRLAFNSQRLFVVYQPQIDLASGKVSGFEALLRWRNDEGQYVPPDQFIPVAEQSGMIICLGNWVLRTALGVQRKLAAAGFPLRMAVNVSSIQFRQPDFASLVEAAVVEAQVDPAMLELEITESVAMFGSGQVQERLLALKKQGVLVAIDDFGTGFSSLSYLDRLPADCLKIDRAFVAALRPEQAGARIAEMVIQLGRRLGMRMLAEGVEDEAQMRTLIELGCHEAQGWHFAKGMPEDELLAWLTAR